MNASAPSPRRHWNERQAGLLTSGFSITAPSRTFVQWQMRFSTRLQRRGPCRNLTGFPFQRNFAISATIALFELSTFSWNYIAVANMSQGNLIFWLLFRRAFLKFDLLQTILLPNIIVKNFIPAGWKKNSAGLTKEA